MPDGGSRCLRGTGRVHGERAHGLRANGLRANGLRARALVAVTCLVAVVVLGAVPGWATEAGDPSSSPTADPVGPLDDPYRPQQWYLDRIGLTDLRPVPTGSGQVIAIIDSGVDLEHPDLEPVLARHPDGSVLGWDFVDDDADPQDVLGHGTMVAGVAAARAGNGVGTRGVAPGARLMPLRVLDEDGYGNTDMIAAAVNFAVDNGATIVNLSLESADQLEVLGTDAVGDALRRAEAADIVVVMAAGNDAEQLTELTHGLGVVVVGASDRQDRRARFSDGGRDDLVLAPGVEIVSSWCRLPDQPVCDGSTHNQGVADGTSFAAPQVAGVIALLREAGLQAGEAVEHLRANARDVGEPGPDAATGVGILDLAGALGPWPDGPIIEQSVTGQLGEVSELPADATPLPIAVAAPPTGSRAILWAVVVVVAAVVLAVGRGLVVDRRIRPMGTMPDLRPGDGGQ